MYCRGQIILILVMVTINYNGIHELYIPLDCGMIWTPRCILYLKLWISNSDHKLIGRKYLKHLYESKGEICTPVNVSLSLLSPDHFFPPLE